MALPFVAMLGWIWAVFHASNGVLPHPRSPYWGWVCAAPPAIVLVAGAAGWSTHNSPSAFAFFIGLFVAIWLAATALEKAQESDGKPTAGQVFGTGALMYFIPVGVWVLRARILRAVG